MFGNTNVCVRSWSQFSSCPLFWPMQHRQEAGATVYSTIPAVPPDTTDSSGFHTAWGLAARPPQPLRDPQLPMLPLQCWQLIWGPKKQRGHLLPLPPSSLGLARAELSCNQTSGGLCHFQMQPWEGGVTIKDVLDLGRVEGNCWAARKTPLHGTGSCKTDENGLHSKAQATWTSSGDTKVLRKDLAFLRYWHRANIEHSWLAPELCSDCCWLLKVRVRWALHDHSLSLGSLQTSPMSSWLFCLHSSRGLVSVLVIGSGWQHTLFFLPSVPITCGVCVTKFWAGFWSFYFF